MTPTENLYYALGEMIYALAAADGEIQKAEKDNLHDILSKEFLPGQPPTAVSEIIFRIFQKDHLSVQDAFERGKRQFELNSHYLSPEMKVHFIKVMQQVAHAYPPVTSEEQRVLNDFQAFLTKLEGDPVFYAQ